MPQQDRQKVDATLSDLQYQVMQILWEQQECSASQVQQALADNGRELALTTVSTLLTRLEKRGLVEARREGRQVSYAPLVSERDVRRSMVRELVGTLFAGNTRELVSHLVKESELKAGDLQALRDLLDSSDDGKKSK